MWLVSVMMFRSQQQSQPAAVQVVEPVPHHLQWPTLAQQQQQQQQLQLQLRCIKWATIYGLTCG